MKNLQATTNTSPTQTKPFRDETVSLIEAAEREARNHLYALQDAVNATTPKLVQSLSAIHDAARKMTDEDKDRYVQQRGVKKNGNVQNQMFYLVRAAYKDDDRISTSQYTKYAGAIALAIAIKPNDMTFSDFLKEHKGIEGANDEFAKSKPTRRNQGESDQTRRVEAIHREIAAYLGNPLSPPIDAPELAAGLQEGLDYVAVIRKVNGLVVILRTLDYERPALTRMLQRFAIAASKVQS